MILTPNKYIMKRIATVLFCLLCASINAQQLLLNDSISLKSNFNERRESIPIVDEFNEELSMFIVDRKNIYLKNYNKSFEVLEEYKFERPKTSLKNIVQACGSREGGFTFLITNTKNNKYNLINVSTQQQNIKLLENEIIKDNESFLKSFTYKNYIYLLAIRDKTSFLHLYQIDEKSRITDMFYDLSNIQFYEKSESQKTLYEILVKRFGLHPSIQLEFIDGSVPNSLESTSKTNKLYVKNNTLTLTLDGNNEYTHILKLNLKNSNIQDTIIKKPQLLNIDDQNSSVVKTNSFYEEDKLYQISSVRGQMRFFIQDLVQNKILKEYTILKEDSIPFKNTPIIQDGGAYFNSHREMEKTQKFLRKIALSEVGISVNSKSDTIEITLGGIKEITGGAPMMGFAPVGGAVGVLASTYMTPTFYAYNSYTYTKSTYIKCLFNSNFEHVEGDVNDNAFDKINKFSEKILNKKAETMFKYNDSILFGYYDSFKKLYFLYEFK